MTLWRSMQGVLKISFIIGLFVVCIGFFVYEHHTKRIFPNQNSIGKDLTLESSLKGIPVCTKSDLKRHRILMELMIGWSQFTKENRIRYWLAYGSLVGYVLRRGLLPHDPDIDVFIFANDTKLLLSFSKREFSPVFELRVQPDWKFPDYRNRSYHRNQSINFVAPNARFIHRESGKHIDIWPIHDYDSKNRTFLSYTNGYDWVSTPTSWTLPLKRCNFSEIQVWCPAEPEKHVAKVYGASALYESDTRCVNGSWI